MYTIWLLVYIFRFALYFIHVAAFSKVSCSTGNWLSPRRSSEETEEAQAGNAFLEKGSKFWSSIAFGKMYDVAENGEKQGLGAR